MTQNELHRSVARATGEDLREICRRGFSIVDPRNIDFDPEPDNQLPQMIDWDQHDLERNVPLVAQRQDAA